MVDRAKQLQLVDQGLGSEVKVGLHVLRDLLFFDDARTESVHVHANGFGNADGVSDLHLALAGKASSDDVLGNVARVVTSAAIDLGRVLAREGAAAVTAHAAVAVDDDLSARETAITHRPAHNKAPCGVDVKLGALVDEALWDHLVDDQFHHCFFELRVLHALAVLRADDHGVHAHGLAIQVLEGDLGFAVGAEEVDLLLVTDGRQLFGELVCEIDGHRHELGGLVAGVTEHEALIASALLFVQALSDIDALRDVWALLLYGREHGAGGAVKPGGAGVVADVEYGFACDGWDVDPGAGGDLASDHKHAGLGQGFAGDARMLVLRENRVEDSV